MAAAQDTQLIHDAVRDALAADARGADAQPIIDKLRQMLPPMSCSGAYVPYLAPDDSSFFSSLLSKKEFTSRRVKRIDKVTDFVKAAKDACAVATTLPQEDGGFELSESQSMVRNFMSPRTPYNGLLLFHDVGVGKTCSAISIAERFPDRRVTILAPSGVQLAFRKQMFDARKVSVVGDGTLLAHQCTGTTFLKGYSPPAEGIDTHEVRASMDALAQRNISRRYTFTGFTKFGNHVSKLSDTEVREKFSKTLIIVDEAHNLRSNRESGTKPSLRALMRVLHLSHGSKILLLTATPMFNDAREIVDLVNLMLVNDGRPPLKKAALFAEDGSLKGSDALARACTGYVSHVSGRNPLRFPMVLSPDMSNDPAVVKPARLPVLDITGEKIAPSMRIKATQIVGSHLSESQYTRYLDSGVSRIRPGLVDSAVSTLERIEITKREDSKDEDVDDIPQSFRPGLETANIAFPIPKGGGVKNATDAFWLCFRRPAALHSNKEFSVEYVPGSRAAADGGFLAFANVGTYSSKIKTIVDRILSGTGISFVYSRFLWAGLVPLAIALEHAGLSRHGQRNVLAAATRPAGIGSYIMLTSNTLLCDKAAFARDLAAVTSAKNADGSIVRVILACEVATEGIDLKCVRAVHLMEPWYHCNKVSQILGRASRNCSHAALPVAQRNVTLYLHAALPPAHLKDPRETVDLHAYRIAEFKQARIDRVEDVLRAASVDCELNRQTQQLDALQHATADIVTSQGTRHATYGVIQNIKQHSKSMHCLSLRDSGKVAADDESSPGDDSTYDAWYHAPDLIDKYLRRIIAIFRSGARVNMRYADIDEVLRDDVGLNYDADMLPYALQKGITSGKLVYRGGVYTESNPLLRNRVRAGDDTVLLTPRLGDTQSRRRSNRKPRNNSAITRLSVSKSLTKSKSVKKSPRTHDVAENPKVKVAIAVKSKGKL